METTAKFINANEMDVAVTITMSLKDWSALVVKLDMMGFRNVRALKLGAIERALKRLDELRTFAPEGTPTQVEADMPDPVTTKSSSGTE